MKTVNTTGLVLGMLAVGGLIAVGAVSTGQVYAQPINAATASNSDDDTVEQKNTAKITQKANVKCKASVDDNDGIQVGLNTNTAVNACTSAQTATVGQANINTDNDVQVATATACQAIALGLGLNICGNAAAP